MPFYVIINTGMDVGGMKTIIGWVLILHGKQAGMCTPLHHWLDNRAVVHLNFLCNWRNFTLVTIRKVHGYVIRISICFCQYNGRFSWSSVGNVCCRCPTKVIICILTIFAFMQQLNVVDNIQMLFGNRIAVDKVFICAYPQRTICTQIITSSPQSEKH